jgi:hypothetical protein
VYLEDDTTSIEHITVANNTAATGANGVVAHDSEATIEDFAFGPGTTTDVTKQIQATLNGTTTQEGATLPNADITIRNADSDTTVGTTTSNSNGDYSFSTSYPDDQAYEASVIADADEHQADTTTVTLDDEDNTYDGSVDLERLVHDLTVNTDDATTGSSIAANGTILDTAADTTITTYTTDSDGAATLTITTAADQISNEADTANYNPATETLSLGGDKAISSAVSLSPITYVFSGTVTDEDGNALNDASITVEDTDNNTLSTTTDAAGDYTTSGTVNDGLAEDESIDVIADQAGYDADTTTTTADPDNRTTTIDFSLAEENTTDRITITFNPKIVGDNLYDGGYGDPFDYTVSTDDTTFTTTGSTTADIPIADGDDLELSTSDAAYLSTVVANNTDTEQPPFQGNGFPDEPDYQNTEIAIPKSDVVNEYQVAGFPATSPDGHSVADEYLPHINEATRFKDRQVDGETLDKDKIYVVESDDEDWNDKVETAISDVRDVTPFPTTPPVFVPDIEALQDSADTRDNFNLTYVEVDASTNNQFYDSGYIKFTKAGTSISDAIGTSISEVYSSIVDMDETGGNDINDTIFDGSNTLDKDEAALPVRFEYNSISNSTLQP